jgi:hypothetical protein
MVSDSACGLFWAVCSSYLDVDKSLTEMGAVCCFYVRCGMDTKTYLDYMGLQMKC